VNTVPLGDRRPLLPAAVRAVVPVVVVVLVLGAAWEAYKALGQAWDDTVPGLGWEFPVRTDDTSMPHAWSVVEALGDPGESGVDAQPLWRVLWDACLFTLREAAAGLLIGGVIGVVLAVGFTVLPIAGRALLPWIVVSQTIPFVATAPMVVIWGGRRGWDPWVSVSVIASYLAFFPVVVNMRRGLAAVDERSLELMRSYAASRWTTLVHVRLPVALPYLFTGLKLAATAAVVGAIVGELPSGQAEGVGRLLLTFASFFTLAPERLFAGVAAAALLGLAFVGVVALAERLVLGARAAEAA
jgi:NitT/TauT family transport system permease protein